MYGRYPLRYGAHPYEVWGERKKSCLQTVTPPEDTFDDEGIQARAHLCDFTVLIL